MSLSFEQLTARYGSRYKWLVLMTVMTDTMAAILSSTIVNVAVPDLSRHFILGQQRAQWVALQYVPSQAGLILLPAGIVLAVVIPLAGRLADRFEPRILVAAGLSLLALSFALMAVSGSGASYVMLMVLTIVGRIGLGFVLPALSLGAMRGIEPALIAQGASTISFLRQLGGAIGVSFAGIILEWRLAAHHTGLATQVADPSRIEAFDDTFWLVAIICASAVLAAWRMRPLRSGAT